MLSRVFLNIIKIAKLIMKILNPYLKRCYYFSINNVIYVK